MAVFLLFLCAGGTSRYVSGTNFGAVAQLMRAVALLCEGSGVPTQTNGGKGFEPSVVGLARQHTGFVQLNQSWKNLEPLGLTAAEKQLLQSICSVKKE